MIYHYIFISIYFTRGHIQADFITSHGNFISVGNCVSIEHIIRENFTAWESIDNKCEVMAEFETIFIFMGG